MCIEADAQIKAFVQHQTPIDSSKCVEISTKFALREMIWPGLLVISAPLVIGYLFSTTCLSGLLAGNLVSGVQMAISMSNSGGAWDNCKKGI